MIAEQTILYILFRDKNGKMNIEWLDDFFLKEKLPFDKGFTLKGRINTIDFLKTAMKLIYLGDTIYY